MLIILPVTTANLLLALAGLCAAAAFLCALSLLDSREQARRIAHGWSIWLPDADSDDFEDDDPDDDDLPDLDDTLAWFLAPPTQPDLPALPPQARVVASCRQDSAVNAPQGQQHGWRGEMV